MIDLLSIPDEWHGDSTAWSDVETDVGSSLPGQFKNLVETLGADLSLGEVHVLSPYSANKHLNLAEKSRLILESDRELRRANPQSYPIPLHPERGGLFPWAVTDNGEVIYWITKGDPNHWPILVKDARAPEFEVHFTTPCQFLQSFRDGTLRSGILS